MKFVCKNLLDTKKLATKAYRRTVSPSIIFITGEIGAGKTTFVKYCLEDALNSEFITSPTFNLLNIYKTTDNKKILHLDLYRVEHYTELYQLGIEDYFNDSVIFIEWPDAFSKAFEIAPTYNININTTNDSNVREFDIFGLDL